MGWVWRDDETNEFNSSSPSREIATYRKSPNSSSGEKLCSTRTVMKSQCRTEEVEPGKFIRKCEKTEEVLRECLGDYYPINGLVLGNAFMLHNLPVEVLKSNKEYTEDDVTQLVGKGSSSLSKFDDSPFGFPGFRSDIEGIEHHFLGGINRFFEAAEQMQNSIFDTFGDLFKGSPSSSPSMRRGIPIEDFPQREAFPKDREPLSGDVDLSGLAKDV